MAIQSVAKNSVSGISFRGNDDTQKPKAVEKAVNTIKEHKAIAAGVGLAAVAAVTLAGLIKKGVIMPAHKISVDSSKALAKADELAEGAQNVYGEAQKAVNEVLGIIQNNGSENKVLGQEGLADSVNAGMAKIKDSLAQSIEETAQKDENLLEGALEKGIETTREEGGKLFKFSVSKAADGEQQFVIKEFADVSGEELVRTSTISKNGNGTFLSIQEFIDSKKSNIYEVEDVKTVGDLIVKNGVKAGREGGQIIDEMYAFSAGKSGNFSLSQKVSLDAQGNATAPHTVFEFENGKLSGVTKKVKGEDGAISKEAEVILFENGEKPIYAELQAGKKVKEFSVDDEGKFKLAQSVDTAKAEAEVEEASESAEAVVQEEAAQAQA